MAKKQHKDVFGHTIFQDDWISYPGRSGSSLWMNVAKVVKLEKDKVVVVAKSITSMGKAHLTAIQVTDRAVPLDYFSIPQKVSDEIDMVVDRIREKETA